MLPELPEPRHGDGYRIALVCLGNICRSPMADVVLEHRVGEAGLADRVRVASCGTGGWHVGRPMDDRAAATLTAAGYDATRHRAQQLAGGWLEEFDLLLAMDRQNLADVQLHATADTQHRVRLFRDFDPVGPGSEVPDPYYGGGAGFEEVLTMVERTSAAIVAALQQRVPRWWDLS
ncbi:low molecular weight protein-tyrosine-phosphatase [Nocardioides ferulae]|uniref:low molecular weight protein-tyrosine-phosphatase n=1 Tax=Nocardioides ferulae TaxID=2340821 RepID=UPI000EAFEC02|nr:low molecular weight protein-tyrosine-phosphatase [Nocardioides ferulae]